MSSMINQDSILSGKVSTQKMLLSGKVSTQEMLLSGKVSTLPSGGDNYILQTKEVTPTKSQQSITPDAGKYGLSSVTVKAIPDTYQNVSGVTAVAADVLENKTIVTATGESVEGIMPNNGTINKTIDGLTVTSYSVPAGYTFGGTVSLTNDIEMALAAI